MEDVISDRDEQPTTKAKVSININGKDYSGQVDGRTLLSSFIREEARLTGTHIGCDTSQCGSCVVDLDGKSIKSCSVLAISVDGYKVITIEGLADKDGNLSKLQASFKKHHALQCGFCTPGMIMSARDLLANNPKPTEAEVRFWLKGNICRCTGYNNIVKAIMDV